MLDTRLFYTIQFAVYKLIVPEPYLVVRCLSLLFLLHTLISSKSKLPIIARFSSCIVQHEVFHRSGAPRVPISISTMSKFDFRWFAVIANDQNGRSSIC